ncbi:MAG TPA: serine/threonine-protein kinase [Anaeromyxobacteraceae bacterium]|nr:serine/threonine-protein kinase [Anaeromyxobacteraceae bacterium]
MSELPRVPGYRVEALLGRGGMAEVFRGRALAGPRAGWPVAIKMLLPAVARDPEQVRLFGREAAITSRLRHPHIVEIYDAGMAEDGPFIAMEYVDGKNLRQVISRCAARSIWLPLDFAAYLSHVLAQALEHAHRARDPRGQPLGLVHCDVSPQNVFISRRGEVKLGDFGVARAAGEGRGQAAFGKVRYLAPEQLLGGEVGPRTDVFALGAVLFELLTNQPAFPGDDPQDVGRRIVAGERRAPSSLRPEVPFELDELVLRALGPADRIETAAEFARLVDGRYDPRVGTELAIAAVVRGLFGPE